MNCKPGDLAVYVGGAGERAYHGKRFVVLHAAEPDPILGAFWWVQPLFDSPAGDCADAHIRPIRDSDGQDETLSWVPKKETV